VTQSPPEPPPGQSSSNTASDGANVGMQVGFMDYRVNIYAPTENESPAARYGRAVRLLDADACPQAASLIAEAVVKDDFRGAGPISANHVAFHWMLAVLGGAGHVTGEDRKRLQPARALIDPGTADSWLDGCRVIDQLLECVRRQEEQDPSGRIESGYIELLVAYNALSDECRDGIQRHLESLLTGSEEAEIETVIVQAAEARRDREREERIRNAWKFFEPIPAEAREKPPDEPNLLLPARILAGAGAVLGLASFVYWLILLQRGGVVRALLIGAVLIVGGVLAALSAISYAATSERLAAREREHGLRQVHSQNRYSLPEPGSSSELGDDPDEAETDEAARKLTRRKLFVALTARQIREEFGRHAPRAASARKRWLEETAGLKKTLKDEILALYSNPSVLPGSVDWLICHRVTQIAKQWRENSLRDFRTKLQPGARTVLGLGLGLIAVAAAAIYAVIVMLLLQPAEGVLATVAIAAAALLAGGSRIDLYAVQRRAVRDSKPERAARFQADEDAHKQWVDDLKGRPSDADIARWLSDDKIHIKQLALDQLGLARSDVLSSATLVEPGPGRYFGMRVPFGPPRYTHYRVSVFVLTRAGVRQVSVTLDIRTGDVYDQIRRSFRHDAIASATVHETGIRFNTGRREAISAKHRGPRRGTDHAADQPDSAGPDEVLPDSTRRGRAEPGSGYASAKPVRFDESLILRQQITLHLMSSQVILLQVQTYYADLSDAELEDPAYLLNIALDTSGISGVVQVLEAISGHGSQWAAQWERQQQLRRQRASRPASPGRPGPDWPGAAAAAPGPEAEPPTSEIAREPTQVRPDTGIDSDGSRRDEVARPVSS
jgi:hypothetical protein